METKKMRNGMLVPLFVFIFSGCAIPFETVNSHQPVVVRYENPIWAPTYYSGVRYYYFPDLELYYDLSNQDFIFLNDGRWYFSRELPPFYSQYDLNNAFVVSLNVKVYQPWRHHQYYVSNYPRYYYKNFYGREKYRVRGFNENEKSAIYYKHNDNEREEINREGDGRRPRTYNPGRERDETRGYNVNREHKRVESGNSESTDNKSGRTSRTDNSNEYTGKKESSSNTEATPTRDSGGRSSTYSREPQDPNYYGKKIGQPVKVERQMREPKEKKEVTKSSGRR
ncbi:MAG: hypothetical protein PHV20_12870 [Bacteroidales bacterium]|nr:hypothetical protein [Bacteroidales bacterium]